MHSQYDNRQGDTAMNTQKRLKKIALLSSTLLLAASWGMLVKTGIAEAKPPRHAPAWGYRCQHNERDRHFDRSECKESKNQNRKNNDRYEDYDYRYKSEFNTGRLYAGITLPVEYSGSQRVIITRDENYPLTLRVSRNIKDEQNQVLIPRGSLVEGEFRPAGDGMRFVARRLILSNNKSYKINAESRVIDRDRNLRSIDLDNIRISDAARVLVGTVASNGRITKADSDLFVVYPGNDLDLTLKSDLRIR